MKDYVKMCDFIDLLGECNSRGGGGGARDPCLGIEVPPGV